jgi:CheY-like chemotaxis protein
VRERNIERHDEASTMSQDIGAGEGTAAVERGSLEGKTILVVEREPLVALDLQRALEAAGAEVVVAGNAKEAVSCIRKSRFAAGVIDWHPSSEDHRLVARALKQASVRFLFYATHSPEDVTTVRGAPIFLKPGRPEDIVQALVMLTGACGRPGA